VVKITFTAGINWLVFTLTLPLVVDVIGHHFLKREPVVAAFRGHKVCRKGQLWVNFEEFGAAQTFLTVPMSHFDHMDKFAVRVKTDERSSGSFFNN